MILATLFISGCNIQTNPDQPTDSYNEEGRDGIEINFVDDAVPKKIYSNSDINFMIEARNLGRFSHELEEISGNIFLYGYDKSKVVFTNNPYDSSQKIDLPKMLGKSKFLPDGGYSTVTFPVERISLLSRTTYEPTFVATACYHYRTLATPTVCLIPETTMTERSNNICRPKTQTFDSQGAPVAITKIEEEVLGKTTNFVITVENVGSGKVFDAQKETLANCPFKLNQGNMNKVDIDVRLRINGLETKAECSSDTIVLVNDIGTAYCTFEDLNIQSSYTTQLITSLDYNYLTTAKKTIEIISTR